MAESSEDEQPLIKRVNKNKESANAAPALAPEPAVKNEPVSDEKKPQQPAVMDSDSEGGACTVGYAAGAGPYSFASRLRVCTWVGHDLYFVAHPNPLAAPPQMTNRWQRRQHFW